VTSRRGATSHQRHERHHAEHGAGATHVVLHAVHGRAGLDGQATGVERDPLAHQSHPATGLAVGAVRELHEAGLLERSAVHAEQPPHVGLGDAGQVEHLDLDAQLACQLHGLVGEHLGDQVAAGGVDQVPDQADGRRQRHAPGHGVGHLLAALADDGGRFQRGAGGRVLVVGEAVGAEGQAFGERLGGTGPVVALEHGEGVDADRDLLHRRLGHRGTDLAVGGRVGLLTQPDQQAGAGIGGSQQRLADVAREAAEVGQGEIESGSILGQQAGADAERDHPWLVGQRRLVIDGDGNRHKRLLGGHLRSGSHRGWRASGPRANGRGSSTDRTGG